MRVPQEQVALSTRFGVKTVVKTPLIRALGVLLEREADSPSHYLFEKSSERGERRTGGQAPKADNRPFRFVDSESAKRSTMITILVRGLGLLWKKTE